MQKNIKGVIIKTLTTHSDDRGWLAEIYRTDDDQLLPVMGYVSHTKRGVIRGPHEHVAQTDFFVFIGPGDFELHLWDNRKDSETFTNKINIIVGESNKVSVIVPPGVVHGYKSISNPGSLSINLPDKLFAGTGKKEKIDEIRHENYKESIFKIE